MAEVTEFLFLGQQLKNEEQVHQLARALLWMSYRTGFEPLAGTALISDAHWGCLLRSAQMLLANTFLKVFSLSPPSTSTSTSTSPSSSSSPSPPTSSPTGLLLSEEELGNFWVFRQADKRAQVCEHFLDFPDRFLSVHKLCEEGALLGLPIGSWFAPSIISQVFQKIFSLPSIPLKFSSSSCDLSSSLSSSSSSSSSSPSSSPSSSSPSPSSSSSPHSSPNERRFRCIVAHHGTIEGTELGEMLQGEEGGRESVLVLVQMRLGVGQTVNPLYIPEIQRFFGLPQCMGIIGGAPGSSFYFVGCRHQEGLYYLDPHTVQPVVDDCSDLSSFHAPRIGFLPFLFLDPSLALAFLCSSMEDLDTLANFSRHSSCPLFSVVFSPSTLPLSLAPPSPSSSLLPPSSSSSPNLLDPDLFEDEEFVLL